MLSAAGAATCLWILVSAAIQPVCGRPTTGVWIRLDELAGKEPKEVANSFLTYGIGAAFILVPLPPTEDEMAQLRALRASLPPNVQIHLWLGVYRNARYLEANPEEQFVSINGSVVPGWVNPVSATYRDKLVAWIHQIIGDLQANGVFLDYFYVPFGPFDNATLKNFSSFLGTNVSASALTASEYLLTRFLEWRNGKILETLRAVKRETDVQGLKLSIFIRMVEESERLASGQDVERFAEIADFLVPNSYHVLVHRDANWVGACVQALKAAGAKSVWAGIQAYDTNPLEVGRAARWALKSRADGIVLFRYGTATPQYWHEVRLALLRRTRSSYWAVLLPASMVTCAVAIFLLAKRGRGAREGRRGRRKVSKPARRR